MINGGYPETPDGYLERLDDGFMDETLADEDRDVTNETREANPYKHFDDCNCMDCAADHYRNLGVITSYWKGLTVGECKVCKRKSKNVLHNGICWSCETQNART